MDRLGGCHETLGLLRWHDTIKYGDAHEKFNFTKIEDLRPLNTCQKHFQTILPNFPLDECEIWGNYTEVQIFYVAMAIATVVYYKTVTKNTDKI